MHIQSLGSGHSPSVTNVSTPFRIGATNSYNNHTISIKSSMLNREPGPPARYSTDWTYPQSRMRLALLVIILIILQRAENCLRDKREAVAHGRRCVEDAPGGVGDDVWFAVLLH